MIRDISIRDRLKNAQSFWKDTVSLEDENSGSLCSENVKSRIGQLLHFKITLLPKFPVLQPVFWNKTEDHAD